MWYSSYNGPTCGWNIFDLNSELSLVEEGGHYFGELERGARLVQFMDKSLMPNMVECFFNVYENICRCFAVAEILAGFVGEFH